MTSAVVRGPGRGLEVVSSRMPTPAPGQVRVEVVASGMCGADLGTVASSSSAYGFPLTPGHEIAGVVADLGEQVVGWRTGDRVAIGWFGGSCGHCTACRRGDLVHCPDRLVTGVSYPGGWAESIIVPADALARISDQLTFAQAAPFGCAGVTTFNALRNATLRPGSRVAVFGLGGLGHLATQFATRMGHETVVIARGNDRERWAVELGAHTYVDSTRCPPGVALGEMGGADLIIATASSTEATSALVDGLAIGGQLTLLGVDAGAIQVPVARLVTRGQKITGHLTGTPSDIEDAMAFAVTNGVEVIEEIYALEDAAQALERLASGTARFRIVLEAAAAPRDREAFDDGGAR
ncbi:alcohol dehydrogenase catalytic domain-containing protein [Nocardioides sp. BGMRC 2183]|nr:alcohol dehydrogenase catalytic domain-containing protein [Nocardioides sp. BGMRC 2183]